MKGSGSHGALGFRFREGLRGQCFWDLMACRLHDAFGSFNVRFSGVHGIQEFGLWSSLGLVTPRGLGFGGVCVKRFP